MRIDEVMPQSIFRIPTPAGAANGCGCSIHFRQNHRLDRTPPGVYFVLTRERRMIHTCKFLTVVAVQKYVR